MAERTAGRCFDDILSHWSNPLRSDSICHSCPLWHQDLNPIFGVGNRVDPKVMAIAESPNEDRPRAKANYNSVDPKNPVKQIEKYWHDATFSDNQYFRQMARSFTRIFRDINSLPQGKESVYLVNLWRCSNKRIGRFEKCDAFMKCSRHLESELKSIRPKAIVAFGEKAWDGLIWTLRNRIHILDPVRPRIPKKGTFKDFEGRVFSVPKLKCRVIPVFHWSRGEAQSGRTKKQPYHSRVRKLLQRNIDALA